MMFKRPGSESPVRGNVVVIGQIVDGDFSKSNPRIFYQ